MNSIKCALLVFHIFVVCAATVAHGQLRNYSSAVCYDISVLNKDKVIAINNRGEMLFRTLEGNPSDGHLSNGGYVQGRRGRRDIIINGLESEHSPKALNDRGQVVGTYQAMLHLGSNDLNGGYIWKSGKITLFPPDDTGWLALNDINNSGVAVGDEVRIVEGTTLIHAVRLKPSRFGDYNKVYLTTNPNAQWAHLFRTVSGINNHNTVIGSTGLGLFFPQIRATIGVANEETISHDALLSFPGIPENHQYEKSAAYALNDNNEVVGVLRSADSVGHQAVRWRNGMVTRLGTLGGEYSQAFDINSHGVIVGESTLEDSRFEIESHAFIYRNGVMLDLNGLHCGGPQSSDMILRTAMGINDSGVIVGGATIGGESFSYFAKPRTTRRQGERRSQPLRRRGFYR